MARAKKTHELLEGTVLARLLLWDGGGSSYCDTNPVGAYYSTREGEVLFTQQLRCAAELTPCSTAPQVDRLVMKVFFAAAKHLHRYLVVSQKELESTLRRLPDPTHLCVGLNINLRTSSLERRSTVLPPNVLIHSNGHPEDIGMLSYSEGAFGVLLGEAHRITVLEVAPDPSRLEPPIKVS